MYQKYGVLVLTVQVLLSVLFSVKGVEVNRIASKPAYQIRFAEDFMPVEESSHVRSLFAMESSQRVVDYQVIEQKNSLSAHDKEVLFRIVEAEAGNEDLKGRILVANVILNRVESQNFPNSVEAVVFQREQGRCQFSPISDGRYFRVKVSEKTKEAVERAVTGEDYSRGALFFAARKYAKPERMRWFDTHLTKLFAYGGHEFFC